MLEEIYNIKREEIDLVIKQALKSVQEKLEKIDFENNKKMIEKIEENYNIKLGAVCKELYIKGLKDGINLMTEINL